MSFYTATKWAVATVKSVLETSDMSGLSDNICFMTDGVVKKSPEKILKDACDMQQFTGLMKILIVLLLDGKGVTKAGEYQKIATMDDGRELIDIVINGFSASGRISDASGGRISDASGGRISDASGAQRPGSFGRTQAVEKIVKICLAKIEGLARPGVTNDIFLISMGVRVSGSTIDHDDSAILSFKINVRTGLAKLANTRNRMEELDHYFLSLAAAGPAAADMYHEHLSDASANKSCVFQSLLHPEFSVEQFLNSGPVAMFYNNSRMLAEIAYVLESDIDDDCMHSLRWTLVKYCTNLTKSNYHRHRTNQSDSAFRYLAMLHGITKKSNVDIWKQLKLRLGNRIGHPAYAFSRPM